MASGPSAADIKKHSSKTLKVGSKGDPVKCLQGVLNQNGAKLEADGQFGKGTKKAVVDFQKKKKLGADGIVGPKTWAALAGKAPPKEKPDAKKKEEDKKDDAKKGASAGQCQVKVRVVCPGANRAMQPVQGAVVRLGRVKGRTATNGEASLSVPPGKYKVLVSKSGYEPTMSRALEVKAAAGKTVETRVDMKSAR